MHNFSATPKKNTKAFLEDNKNDVLFCDKYGDIYNFSNFFKKIIYSCFPKFH